MNVFRIVRARSAKQSGIIGGKRPFDPNIKALKIPCLHFTNVSDMGFLLTQAKSS